MSPVDTLDAFLAAVNFGLALFALGAAAATVAYLLGSLEH